MPALSSPLCRYRGCGHIVDHDSLFYHPSCLAPTQSSTQEEHFPYTRRCNVDTQSPQPIHDERSLSIEPFQHQLFPLFPAASLQPAYTYAENSLPSLVVQGLEALAELASGMNQATSSETDSETSNPFTDEAEIDVKSWNRTRDIEAEPEIDVEEWNRVREIELNSLAQFTLDEEDYADLENNAGFQFVKRILKSSAEQYTASKNESHKALILQDMRDWYGAIEDIRDAVGGAEGMEDPFRDPSCSSSCTSQAEEDEEDEDDEFEGDPFNFSDYAEYDTCFTTSTSYSSSSASPRTRRFSSLLPYTPRIISFFSKEEEESFYLGVPALFSFWDEDDEEEVQDEEQEEEDHVSDDSMVPDFDDVICAWEDSTAERRSFYCF